MNKPEAIEELQQCVNSMYYVLSQLTCDKWIEDEIYPSIYKIESIIQQLENDTEA